MCLFLIINPYPFSTGWPYSFKMSQCDDREEADCQGTRGRAMCHGAPQWGYEPHLLDPTVRCLLLRVKETRHLRVSAHCLCGEYQHLWEQRSFPHSEDTAHFPFCSRKSRSYIQPFIYCSYKLKHSQIFEDKFLQGSLVAVYNKMINLLTWPQLWEMGALFSLVQQSWRVQWDAFHFCRKQQDIYNFLPEIHIWRHPSSIQLSPVQGNIFVLISLLSQIILKKGTI